MPKYSFKHSEIHQVIIECHEEFDTTDQSQWDSILERVAEMKGEDYIEDFPEKAPTEPEEWFELLQLLDATVLAHSADPRWISDEKGFTGHNYELYDANNRLVAHYKR